MGIRLLHLHLHGLFRSHELELGRDADTGGQTLYIQRLATGISVPPQFELMGTKQTVKVQMQQPDPHSLHSQTTTGRRFGAVVFSLEAEEGVKNEKNLRRPTNQAE